MSKLYIDIVKDRAYVEKRDGIERRSAQTTMYLILSALVRLMSPILAFTSDEIWKAMPHRAGEDKGNVYLTDMPEYNENFPYSETEKKYDRLMELRDEVLAALEVARADKMIGKSLEARVVITADGENHRFLSEFTKQTLEDVFIVSDVLLQTGTPDEGKELGVKVERAAGEKCVRCWKQSEQAVQVGGDRLCPRCRRVLGI